MNLQKTIGICIIFLFGFLSANILGLYLIYGFEVPLSLGSFNFSSPSSNSAPFDFIKEEQIQILEDKVIINVEGVSLSKYAATGSMLPVLNEYSNGIKIVPKSEEDIHVGDIITFEKEVNGNSILIVHRVIEIGTDEKGTYFITKGDNNPISDGKIRFKNIKYKTIGILW
jgi:hypothetical protein